MFHSTIIITEIYEMTKIHVAKSLQVGSQKSDLRIHMLQFKLYNGNRYTS